MPPFLDRIRSREHIRSIPALAIGAAVRARSAVLWRAPAAVLLAVLLAGPVAAQKKVLTLEDYPRWNRITEVTLSADGRWMTYAYVPNEGDGTFHVRELDGSTVHTAKNGRSPVFSEDSRWVAFLTGPGEEEARRLRRERKPVPQKLELIDLRTGRRHVEEDVQSFRFSKDSRFIAIEKRRADANAAHQGRDLIVRELETGASRNIGNTAGYAWNEPGTLLAYVVDAANKAGNGVYVLDPASGATHALDTDTLRYDRLAWNEDGSALAVLRGETPEGTERRANVLLVFTGLAPGVRTAAVGHAGEAAGMTSLETWAYGDEPSAESGEFGGTGSAAALPRVSGTATVHAMAVRSITYDPAADPNFPEGFVLSELGQLEWSKDGSRIFVGIKEQKEKVERKSDEPRANVDIWHWKDERIQSVQMVQAEADRRFTYAGVVHVDDRRFVRLADRDMPRVEPTADARWAIGQLDGPYRLLHDEQGGLRDIVRVDVSSGERLPLARRVRYPLGASPDSRWYLYFQDSRLKLLEIATGREIDLSARIGEDLKNAEADYPGERSSYGIGGWSRDGKTLIVNGRYDLWSVALDGGEAVNLTARIGEREKIRFRVVSLDEEDREKGIDTSKPLILSAYGDRTKKSGYWSVTPGEAPRPLIWQDRMIRGLRRAKNADRVAFTSETFEEFPDWYVSDVAFRNPRRVTDANPHKAEYAWGRRVLIDYVDSRGNELQATLTLPAGYEPGRKYPMIVYFYERMSQRHHEFSMPVYDDRPHMSVYASDGYLVLMPDVVYDVGRPGTSALDDVTSAVRKVIELGYADPERIGLQGHSWGGYQSSFIVTQTDMFAAVVTGAPLTNLESMHNILYKQTGGANAPLIQWGQGRMATTPWEDPEAYARESPVRHVANIRTPFLILHGTADGAVDWNQGLEFYIAARRAGKEVILLSYPDEPHHLQKKENQIDFQRRMKEYFDHYLKGAPAPKWMTEGVAYLEK